MIVDCRLMIDDWTDDWMVGRIGCVDNLRMALRN